MRDLYVIMDKIVDAKYSVESMKYLTEFLIKACEEQTQEENVKILGCYNAMLEQAELRINEALDMIDMEIMEQKQQEEK